MAIIIGILLHLLICVIVSNCVAEKTNKKFIWMFFFGVPLGLIITILLDISDAVYAPVKQPEDKLPPIQPEAKPEVVKPLPPIQVETTQNKSKEILTAVGFLVLIGGISFGGGALLHLFF